MKAGKSKQNGSVLSEFTLTLPFLLIVIGAILFLGRMLVEITIMNQNSYEFCYEKSLTALAIGAQRFSCVPKPRALPLGMGRPGSRS